MQVVVVKAPRALRGILRIIFGIKKVEQINSENKKKDSIIKEQEIKIIELSKLEEENQKLRQKIEQYERMESTFNKAILMAQKT